ncbi:HK97 gp10 family phage protein [Methanobrevibacter sp.]|uniref:HK97 gp10 family phage protein n=1 Tax=Methanobrevibacter sp. TaxID=66852 RepID=UPI0038631BCC
MAKDLSQLSDILQQKANTLNNNLEIALKQCGEKIRSDIQNNMSHTERSDKGYHTHNQTKLHYPSTPGNPPAPDTGNLRESIRYEVINNGQKVYGIVGTTQKEPPYGKWLEYGTTKGLKPRPWLCPAMLENAEFIKKVLGQAIRKTLAGGEQ